MHRKLVISPAQLAEIPRRYPIVVSPYGSNGEEIIQQLKRMGISNFIRWPDVVRMKFSVEDLMKI